MHKKRLLVAMLVASLVSGNLNGLGVDAASTTTKYYKTAKTYTFKDKKGIKKIVVNNKKKKIKTGVKSYKLRMTKAGKYKISVVNKKGKTKKYVIYIDKKAPVISGIHNNGTYIKSTEFSVSDNVAVKQASLDGKKLNVLKKKYLVSTLGYHKVVVVDKAGNKSTKNFVIVPENQMGPTPVVTAPSITETPSVTTMPTVTATPVTTGPSVTATPTAIITATPTIDPTATPTVPPTKLPTQAPTQAPTATPTVMPTVTPTQEPTATPTTIPTVTPTIVPTATPTQIPTATSTIAPTQEPTATPTTVPTAIPTQEPTITPTVNPTPTVGPTETMGTQKELFDIVSKDGYILDDTKNTITLKTINPDAVNLDVYASYYLNGKEYKTVFETKTVYVRYGSYEQVGPFCDNSKIETICFKGLKFSNMSLSRIFYGCSSLKSITGFNGENVGMSYAFANCPNLKVVSLDKLTSNSLYYTFYNCSKLTSIDGELIGIEKADMSGCFNGCSELKSVSFSGDISFMNYAFYECKKLNCNIVIPDSVTATHHTFENCSSLEQMPTISKTSQIEDAQNMFSGCSNLKGGVINFGFEKNNVQLSGLFSGCSKLGTEDFSLNVPYSVAATEIFDSNNSIKKDNCNITICVSGYFGNTESLYLDWKNANKDTDISIYTQW